MCFITNSKSNCHGETQAPLLNRFQKNDAVKNCILINFYIFIFSSRSFYHEQKDLKQYKFMARSLFFTFSLDWLSSAFLWLFFG